MIASLEQKSLSTLPEMLIEGLDLIPPDWKLTPLRDNKAPYRTAWQHEIPLTRAQIIAEIESGEAKGFGIRTGKISDGIVAIDFDGSSAMQKALELSGGKLLPDTVTFTSNRLGREQRLYLIPQEYWGSIRTTKIKTGVIDDDGKPEQLELRWDGCQSVLPPSVHPKTGHYHWRRSPQEVALAPAPMWVISAMLAEPELAHHQPERYVTSYTAKSRSGEEWSSEEWALSYLSALGPYRADDYDDWLAVGMALHSVSDCLLSEWDNWSRQSSKYQPGCCEKKWKSFKGQGVALGTLGQMAKQDGWRSPSDKSSGRGYSGGIGSGGNGGGNRRGNCGSSGSGGDGGDGDGNERTDKVVRLPGFAQLPIELVTQEIDNLINRGVTGSQLTGELNRLANVSHIYTGELRKLYYERLDESDVESDRFLNRDEVETLLNLADQSLDLADYLPQSLAQPITQWCNWLNMRPAVALTALLSGISSVHKTGTELVLQRNQNFRVPSTIYAALVSPSGQKKSPIFHNIIRQPLNTLEKEKLTAYKAAMADYEATSQQWEQTKEGEKPQKPKDPPLYYFTNATGEAIPVQAAKDPGKALLALIDELAGYFNSNNAYRNGRGSDKQDLLSYFDGSGQTILRASGVRVNLKNIYLSIFGTIQPDVLKRYMEDCSDPDGNWARFLFVNQPLQAATLHDDDGMAVQISDRLTDFYRQIDQLPEMEYRLSRQAFKRYQGVYDQLERLRVTHPKSGMAAVYSKMEGYIGRLALNLHVLWELDAGKACPDEEIPLFIMDMAIQLAKFFMGQVKLMHANADEESLPTHIVKLIELSKRLEANGKDGWIKAQIYRDQFDSKKRPPAQQARDWMKEAVRLGYGCTRGIGNRLEYHWLRDNNSSDDNPPDPDKLGNFRKVKEDYSPTHPVVETIVNKGVEDNLGNLGKGISNLSLTESESLKPGEEGSSQSLEGGYLPVASLSTLQEGCEADPVDNTEIGNHSGKGLPNFTQVPEYCDSSAQDVTVVESVMPQAVLPPIAPQGIEAVVQQPVGEPLKIGDSVKWSKCPAHCERFSPFEITVIDGDYAKLDLFPNLVPLVELEKCDAAGGATTHRTA